MHITDGFTSKLSRNAMGSPKLAIWPMTYCAHVLTKFATMKPLLRQKFGATNGAPSCLFSLLMLLALSM